jgi:hypothetical protein
MRPCLKTLKSFQLITCVVPLLMASGCIVTDMKNSTEEMNGTTKDMNNTTKEMNDRINSLSKDMAEMKTDTHESLIETKDAIKNTYSDMRQNYTVAVRHDMIEMLEKATALEAKVAAAGKYCMAFEFQLWKNNLGDSDVYREQLFRDAMEEFFLELGRYMSDPNDAPDPTSSKANMQNVMALAGTIDRVNPNAQFLSRRFKSVQQVSISTMFHEALAKSAKVENGEIRVEDLRPFENQVLINRDAAIALLQARANFLPVMALSRISDIQHRSLPMQAVMAYIGSTPNLNNMAAMTEALEFMTNANEEIRFLKSINVSPRLNGSLKALFKNMRLPEPGMTAESQRMSAQTRNVRAGLEAALVGQIKKFKNYATE